VEKLEENRRIAGSLRTDVHDVFLNKGLLLLVIECDSPRERFTGSVFPALHNTLHKTLHQKIHIDAHK